MRFKLPKGVWRFMHFTTLQRSKGRGPYMHRLQIVETPWFSVRLHWIRAADDDRDPHDHPFDFVSFVLFGWYEEEDYSGDYRPYLRRIIQWANVRAAEDVHRIVRLSDRPVVTLVFTGGRRRQWGFRTRRGWKEWRAYREERDGMESFAGAQAVRLAEARERLGAQSGFWEFNARRGLEEEWRA